jgi:hypothetical protein
MQIHHILPDSEDGPGTYENGIPVCLDCHAEIESRSNMGRKFSPEELTRHRERWFTVVREQPWVLIRASRSSQTETGPLEAMVAELEFNFVVVSGSPTEGYPPLQVKQFERAIATNALDALPHESKSRVLTTYKAIQMVNRFMHELAMLQAGFEMAGRQQYRATNTEMNKLRDGLRDFIPDTTKELEAALGRPSAT